MTDLYCLPVRAQDRRFVAERSETVYELPRYDLMRSYLNKHYNESHRCSVDIGGVVYRTSVYIPRGIDDCPYAIVGSSGVPDDQATPPRSVIDLLRSYWTRAKEQLQFGDSVSPVHRTFLGSEFIEPLFEIADESHGVKDMPLTWQEFQNQVRVVIMGEPGSGKTTCLRMLAIKAATQAPSNLSARVPVYIAMRFLKEGSDIITYAAKELGFEPEDFMFGEMLESGRLMLLLDGMDEMDEVLGSEMVRQVRVIAHKYPDVGIAIGTREGGYQSRFPGFTHVRISAFTGLQREEWIQRRIGRTSKKAAIEFRQLLESNPALDDKTATPLMLSLAAVVYEGSGSMPRHTSDLVLRYVDAVVDKWDAERGVTRWKHRPYESRLTVRVLCRTAFHSTLHDHAAFSQGNLRDWESEWVDRVDPFDFLTYIWKGSSLIQSIDNSKWRFQSNAVRDVLCAKYMVERTDDFITSVPVLDKTMGFLPVWRYACEISQDASPLLETILKASLSLEIRASFVAGILVEDIGITEKVQSHALSFLKDAFSTISRSVAIIDEDTFSNHKRVVIAPKIKDYGNMMNHCADIIRSLSLRGIPSKRRVVIDALKDDANWLTVHLTSMQQEGISEAEVETRGHNVLWKYMIS